MRSRPSADLSIARLLTQGAALGTRLCAAARDFLRGCTGFDDYARYLAHQRLRHAEQMPLSREAFFRRELDARWSGVRRCC
jgi:uncharacterized short protein YbdD (DUF466 family)